MGIFRRDKAAEAVIINPLEVVTEKAEPPEELHLDEILGSSTGVHFSDLPLPEETVLFPVAGGVGLSTLVKASNGALHEPQPENITSSTILVATTAASHLAKTAALLRQGFAPNGANIVGVVLVHDRPKLSKATIHESKKVIRMTKHGWVIPYIPALREPGTTLVKYPKRFRTVVSELSRITL